jgi:hypothetical protein
MEQAETNLSDMIRQDEAPVFETSNLDLPDETEAAEAVVEETEAVEAVEETPAVEAIAIAPLNTWFEANSAAFQNVNRVQVEIRGVDSAKTLIMAVLDGQDEINGNPSRDLQVFKNADIQPVLDLAATDMQIYNNGFRLVSPYTDNIVVKSYGVRTGLICVFCNNIAGQAIPYQVVKVKRKDEAVEVGVRSDVAAVTAKLAQSADLEALQLLYKQSSKAVEEMTTNQTAVDWLLARQSEVTDINHHLQIDNVIINILS